MGSNPVSTRALTQTSAVNTGWLIGLTPLWSALLSALLLKERFGPAKIAGLLVGFAGAVLVVTRGQLGAGPPASLDPAGGARRS
jgi:drug/metabolite transporter (DMT)-like permease